MAESSLAPRRASQLPSVARRIETPKEAILIEVEGLIGDTRYSEPSLDLRQFASQLKGDVRAFCRSVLGILAQVDLRAVSALEVPRFWGGIRLRLDPLVVEEVDQELRFGICSTQWYAKTYVVKASHGW